jgi:hypothetical protein
MKEINEAYETLGNLDKRRQYHAEWLRRRNRRPEPQPNDGPPPRPNGQEREGEHPKTQGTEGKRPNPKLRSLPIKWILGIAALGIITVLIIHFWPTTPIFTLSSRVVGSGGTIDPNGGSYKSGATVTITATPDQGYRFDHWGTDASGSANPLSLLVDSNKVVTAYFIKQYQLSVSVDPTFGTVSPNGGTYDANSIVNLAATPSFPYAFENWVGTDNNNRNPTSVTMNADKSVSVTFVQLTKEPPVQAGQQLCNGVGTVPIALNQGEWVEGTIDCGTSPQLHVYIQGPDLTKIQDFGDLGHAPFRIAASVSGTYSVIVEANYFFCGHYNVAYTVYARQ